MRKIYASFIAALLLGLLHAALELPSLIEIDRKTLLFVAMSLSVAFLLGNMNGKGKLGSHRSLKKGEFYKIESHLNWYSKKWTWNRWMWKFIHEESYTNSLALKSRNSQSLVVDSTNQPHSTLVIGKWYRYEDGHFTLIDTIVAELTKTAIDDLEKGRLPLGFAPL